MSFISAFCNLRKETWNYDIETHGKKKAIFIRSAQNLAFLQAIVLFGLVIAAAVTRNTKINLALKIVAGSTVAITIGTFVYEAINEKRRPKKEEENQLQEIGVKYLGKKGSRCIDVICVKYLLSLLALSGLVIAASVSKSTKVDLAFKSVAGITGGTILLGIILENGFLAYQAKKKARERPQERLIEVL